MKADLHEYMKVGMIHFMLFPSVMKGEGPIEETLKKILADDFFDAVEITWINDDAVRSRAGKMLRTSRIEVIYGSQPRLLTKGLNINDLRELGRQEALKSLFDGIDEAYAMKASAFAFLSGKYEESTKERSRAALLDSTFALCEYAKQKGSMPIVLEVFDFDVDKKSLVGPAGYAARFARDVRARYGDFGLLMDLSHLPLTRETPAEALRVVQNELVHVHIGNAVCGSPDMEAYGDLHPRFGFPGSANDVDELSEFLRVLLDIGYLDRDRRPVVSFEVKPWGDEDPDLVCANAKRTLREAWRRIPDAGRKSRHA